MNRKEIERFFKGIAMDFRGEATVFLTGAAAGSVMGGVRPSLDVDFGIQLKSRDPKVWNQLVSAIEKNKTLTGLGTNYDEDIDRWGMITLLDYKKHTKAFKRFGSLAVRVLEPAYWSIGKMTRYLDPDVQDMVAVFKAQKTPAVKLAKLWGKALKASPRSEALSTFRKQVEHFLRAYGPGIWGKKFEASKAIAEFYRSAGLKK